MGWDMRSGFEAATGSTLIVIDGDEQNPVEDVLRMYEEMKQPGSTSARGAGSSVTTVPIACRSRRSSTFSSGCCSAPTGSLTSTGSQKG